MIGWQKPFRGTQLNRTHPLARGLVGAWIMNEATGEVVHDYSGNGNHGAFSGTGDPWNSDYVSFDGSGEKVAIPTMSLSAWTITIKLSGSYTSGFMLPIGGEGWSGQFMGKNDDGFRVRDSGGDVNLSSDTYVAGTIETWTVTYDGTIYKFYTNGCYVGYRAKGGRTFTLDVLGACLGSGFYFSGKIWYNYIYNRALSAEEIALLHREPYCMFTRALDIGALLYAVPVVGGSIINQFQKANLGVDLFNGSLI